MAFQLLNKLNPLGLAQVQEYLGFSFYERSIVLLGSWTKFLHALL
jgi:hypothetical protein